jgi:NAD(P)-dependent dehydrogenase (short-subunit alcohol dehydrogenase family)
MVRGYRDKVAVVTGAANGLGRAVATELAARGCHLALVDIDSSALLDVRESLVQPGLAITHHCVDVSSERALQRATDEIASAHGTVHLVINNAAISASASFANTGAAEFERIIRVNFFGTVYGCRAFLPFLQKHAEGQFLNVASSFAWLGYPGKTAYAASKGALRSFSESLRLELAGSGIGVTLLYPGPLNTSLVRNGISDSEQRRQLEVKFLTQRGLPLERVARRCLDKLVTNPNRIVVGLDYRMMDMLARFSPQLAGWAMGFGSARTGF